MDLGVRVGPTKVRKGFRNRNQIIEPPSREQLKEGIKSTSNPIFNLNQRILEGKAVVKNLLSETSFIVFHEDFRREFIVKKVPDNEDITKWIDLQTHSNVVTAFHQFEENGHNLIMIESTNGGNIFDHIKSLNLNLAVDVPRSYIEKIYDVAIQLITGMDFAHKSGLIHGQFDLSKVVIEHEKESDNMHYRIIDFAPKTSMSLPISTEASYWPFSNQKQAISEREKTEVLMLKDIYSLGIAILELMIGRTSKQTFSISLDSLPLTWAEFPESTPLIKLLVDCIQIDSITQRNGKLQKRRAELIMEYKKYFKRAIYKMETPYVGKKADVFNKRGIIALFHQRDTEALKWWQDAQAISDRHFDSQTNQCMHRWSIGLISDSQLMSELGQFVFDVPNKGVTLEAYLLIATGEREAGLEKLKEYITETKEGIKGQRNKLDLKTRRCLKAAEDVLAEVQLDKTKFPKNSQIKHNHKNPINQIQYSENSGFMTSICSEEVKVWKTAGNLMGTILTSSRQLENKHRADNTKPIAAVSNEGDRVAIYRGGLVIYIYKVVEKEGERILEPVQHFDLKKEMPAYGMPDFTFSVRDDEIMRMKFLGEAQDNLRLYMMLQERHFFVDIELSTGKFTIERAKLFQDASVLGITDTTDTTTELRKEILIDFIGQQVEAGNQLLFPSDNKRIVIVKNKQDLEQKYIQVFDLQRDSFIRRVERKIMTDDACDVSADATLLVILEGDFFNVRSIRVPNSEILVDQLRPRIAVAETKLNPAQACSNRQAFKDKVYRELHTYHMFKEDPKAEKTLGLTEEQNVQLMVTRYDEAVNNQYKMKANREFMMLQKVLLRDAIKTSEMNDLQKSVPLIGVQGLKRIEVYDDELTFASRNSVIDFVQMSSEPHRNFFLIGMSGIVYKYDLVTKELLFSFKTPVTTCMHLYDRDDKLICADQNELRLWDFDDHREEAPELVLLQETPIEIKSVHINKNPPENVPLYVCVVCDREFIVYVDKLSVKFRDKLDESEGDIQSVAYSRLCDKILFGTSSGKIITYDLATGEKEAQVYKLEAQDSGKAITHLIPFDAIQTDDIYLMTLDSKEVFILNKSKGDKKAVDYGADGEAYEGKKITSISVAENNKFFMIGIPDRTLGWFGIDRVHYVTKPLKWITKYKFVQFFTDDHLSSLMLLDKEHKTLDFQFIMWKFDTANIHTPELNKLDNGHAQSSAARDEDTDGIDSQDDKSDKKLVQQSKGSACCTIF